MTNLRHGRNEPVSDEALAEFQRSFNNIKWTIHHYLKRRFRNIDVDEIVGDVMEQVYRHWHTIEHPKKWALRAARNRALNAVQRRNHVSLNDVAGHENIWISTEGVIDRRDDVEEIMQALEKLSKHYRTVLWLSYCGFTNREIATAKNWSYQTVSRYKSDGKKELEVILRQRRNSS